MKRHIRVAVVSASLAGAFVILLGLGLAGCSSASTQSLTTADNGKSVTLDNGQQMTVELEFQGETGYSWEAVDSAGGVLEQQGEPTTKPTASESPTAVVVGQADPSLHLQGREGRNRHVAPRVQAFVGDDRPRREDVDRGRHGEVVHGVTPRIR